MIPTACPQCFLVIIEGFNLVSSYCNYVKDYVVKTDFLMPLCDSMNAEREVKVIYMDAESGEIISVDYEKEKTN